MKKTLLIIFVGVLTFMPTIKTHALMVYNPWYCTYCGFGYMPAANGMEYYIGQIWYGYANGNGYAYFYDSYSGWTAYQGGFYAGVPHGQGETISRLGYIAGVWDRGNFVRQINVSQEQVQQSYNNIMQQSQAYAPQNSNTIKLPPGTEIEQIDSSSELGSKLLGKMSK